MKHILLLLFLFGIAPNIYAQFTQQGSKLVGTGGNATSQQGNAVAVSQDGTTMIVGGPGDGFNTIAGAVWIWTRSGTTWTQQARLVGTNDGGGQGVSVAISGDGNTVIFGSSDDNNGVGAFWIFTRSGTTWTQQGTKRTISTAANSQNGWSVAMSQDGNTAAVGVLGTNSVGILVKDGSGNWNSQATLTTSDANPQMGAAVALSSDGNTVLVGGRNDNNRVGAAWVFTRSGTTWTQQSKLIGTGSAAGTAGVLMGDKVALSSDGNTAFVGGYFDNGYRGAVWVFTRSGTTWSQQGNKLVGTGVTGTYSSQGPVATSGNGNTLVVGGKDDNLAQGASQGKGAIWIFTRSGTTWSQQGSKLTGTGASADASFGTVALSQDGSTLMVGGSGDNSGRGAVWYFSQPVTTAATPTITAGTATGTITSIQGTPSASPNIQQFTVSGAALTGDIVALAPSNFEISTASGSGYAASLILTQASGTVNNTPVYVRSSASAPASSISGNVSLTSTGATTRTVAVAGTISSPPIITVGTATGSITACAGTASVSPAVQQFSVSGSNLTANLVATAPAGFEISSSSGSGFGASVSLTPSGGTVNTITLYVRSSATATGSISGNVSLTSTGATSRTVAVSGTITTPSPDYQPLVDLYNATNGAGWAIKRGWLTGCNPCGWFGVTCDGNGRVAQLDLSANNLSGSIPVSLSALTNLRDLHLSNNQLSGSIPISLSALTNLTYLNLSTNQLSGSIPASLSALTNLQFLLLSANNLSGSIPSSLSALTNLKSLYLNTNQLSGCYPASLKTWCGIPNKSFSNNTGLPDGGSEAGFTAFCSSGGLSSSLPVSISANPSLTITQGSTTQLTASGANTYLWSTGETINPISVSLAGPYSVTGTTTEGCANTATATVSVTAAACTPPIVSLINTGPGTCVGIASLSVGSSQTISRLDWYNGSSLVFTSSPQAATAGSTVAGGNGLGSAANQLGNPVGVYVDGTGAVYVADQENHRIQKWATGAAAGITVAGGNGFGSAANQLRNPFGVYVDGSGAIYVADLLNHRVQKFPPNSTGASSGITVAGMGGQGSAANQLNFPAHVYVDESGAVYVADRNNHRIQKWAAGALAGITIAGGNGAGAGANQLNRPYAVYVDADEAIYVADYQNDRVQKFPPSSTSATTGTTVAGMGGRGSGADQLNLASGVAVDGSGAVYVTEQFNNRVSKWAAGATSGTTVAGMGGQGSMANQLSNPFGVYVDGSGAVYVADFSNGRIQKWAATVNPVYVPTSVGSYSVVVTAADGCTAITNAIAVGPLSVSISPASQTITAGGSVTLTASGATSYTWSNGTTANPLISNVTSATTFSVTGVTGGCSATASAAVSVTLSSLTLTTSASSPSICAGSSASLSVVATGGTAPYTYAWVAPTGAAIAGATNTSAVSVSASTSGVKTFTVTVTGSGGSPVSASTVSISVTANPVVSIGGNLTICLGSATSLSATGANSYSWSSGQNTAVISVTTANTFSVTGTTNGCSSVTSVTTIRRSLPTATVTPSLTPTVCQGQSLTLTASGTAGIAGARVESVPTPSLTYGWSTGSSTASINFIPTSNTVVSLTVNDGVCSSSAISVSVTATANPSAPTLSVSSTAVCGGSVSITATGCAGGTVSFSSTGGTGMASGSVYTYASVGSYTLSAVCIVNSCTSVASLPASVTISTAPNQPVIAVQGAATVCQGTSLTIAATTGCTVGVLTYIYASDDFPTPTAATPAGGLLVLTLPGDYTISALCSTPAGCTGVASAALGARINTNPTVTITGGNVAICAGQSLTLGTQVNVQAQPSVDASVNPYSYVWSPGPVSQDDAAGTAVVQPLTTTAYTVKVTDGNNCSVVSAAVSVTVNSAVTASISPNTTTICIGTSTTLTASGAGAGGTYRWSTGQTTAAISTSLGQVFSVTATSSAGCSSTASATVTRRTLPTVTVTPLPSATICLGQSLTLTTNGTAGSNQVAPVGPTLTYRWSTGAVGASLPLTPTSSTVISVTVSDGVCSSSAISASITVNPAVTATIAATPGLTICAGTSTTLTASGGNGFVWSAPGTGSAIIVSPVSTTAYSVTVTNTTTGCSATATAQITVNQAVMAVVSPLSVTICSGTSTTLTASGGTGYQWSNGANTAANPVSPVSTTAYSVTVTNTATGCSATAVAQVTLTPSTSILTQPAALTTACIGTPLSVSVAAIGTGNLTYQWFQNGQPISVTTATLSIASAQLGNLGRYRVTVTSQCFAVTSQDFVYNLPTVYVTPDGAGDKNGTSWANAYAGNQLQTAIATATTLTTGCGPVQVWVASGLYKPSACTTCPTTERARSFSLAANVRVIGGFQPTALSVYDRFGIRLDQPSSSTLSGAIGTDNVDDNSYHVVYAPPGLTSIALLEGFVIRDGNASGTPGTGFENGGGLYVNGAGTNQFSNPNLTSLHVVNNGADSNGGGMYNDGRFGGQTNGLIQYCYLVGNQAGNTGAGLYNEGYQGTSSPFITNTHFRQNRSVNGYGAAIYNAGLNGGSSSPLLINSVFWGNQAGAIDGAIGNDAAGGGTSQARLINCTLARNRRNALPPTKLGSPPYPGVQIINSILWDNGSDNVLGSQGGVQVLIRNSAYDTAVTSFSNGGGSLTLTASPFVNVIDGDLRLGACGSNTGLVGGADLAAYESVNGPGLDAGFGVRVQGGLLDMGAYEGNQNVLVSVKDGLWSDPSTWSCNRVPVFGDWVSVQHRVTLPGGYVGQAGRLVYGSTGRLVYEPSGRLQFGQ